VGGGSDLGAGGHLPSFQPQALCVQASISWLLPKIVSGISDALTTLTSSSCLLIPILCTYGLVHGVARSALPPPLA
jgi:hypothetical protein